MSSLADIARVASIAQVVHEGRQHRKPPDSTTTFYGRYNLWMFNAVLDDRLCNDCLHHEREPRIFGDQLITTFPYHVIVNDDLIWANVHPNCRCTLTRVVDWTLDDVKWFISVR